MNAFQAYHKPSGKYLHEMKELFGNWARKKGPKQFYTRAADAKGALSNVMYDQPKDYVFNPDDWEIHEVALRIVKRHPIQK